MQLHALARWLIYIYIYYLISSNQACIRIRFQLCKIQAAILDMPELNACDDVG